MERVQRASAKRAGMWVGAAMAIGLGAAFASQASQPGPGAASNAAAPATAGRIATLDVYSLTERLMSLPSGLESVEAAVKPFQDEITKLQEEFDRMVAKLQTLPTNDPSFETTSNEGREKQSKLRRLQGEADAAIEAARAGLLVRTFNQVVEASNKVAAREGFAYVLNSRSAERAIETNSVTIALQELLARPMILAPADADITDRVAVELRLPAEGASPAPVPGTSEKVESGPGEPK